MGKLGEAVAFHGFQRELLRVAMAFLSLTGTDVDPVVTGNPTWVVMAFGSSRGVIVEGLKRNGAS